MLNRFLSYAVNLIFLSSNNAESKNHKYYRLGVVLRGRT
jgi:hypothetical protein